MNPSLSNTRSSVDNSWQKVVFTIAVSGFCDAESTELLPPSDLPPELVEPTSVLWPETEAGVSVTVPCPAGNASAFRQCGSQGAWLEPNTTACEIDSKSDT